MERLAILICAALPLASLADTEIVTVSDGEAAWNHRGGKVAQIHVLSSVASGTATLKSESKLWGTREVITDLSTSNFYWTVVWSNGVDVVTNVSTVAPYPLPPARALISATSNWVVNVLAATNQRHERALIGDHVLVRRRHRRAERQVCRARRPYLLRRFCQGAPEGDTHEVTACPGAR